MLTDLTIKPGYSTARGKLSTVFFNPCLSEANRYCRVSGYFSSASLKYLTKGIESLINKNGTYQLIISNEISKDDYEQIILGYKNRGKLLNKFNPKLDLSEIKTLSDKKWLSNLGYLIEIGLIDIKIGFIHSGLFHAKYGLIHDEAENIVYFSGSANETANGMVYNYETIDVKKSWMSEDYKKYIKEQQAEFDRLWAGQTDGGPLYIKEVNEALKFKLIDHSRGKLIINNEYFTPDSVVLIHSEDGLELVNNIIDEDLGDSRYLSIIKRKYLENESTWSFKKSLTYKDYEDIINQFKKHKKRTKINIIITKSVYDYIEDSKFEIAEIARRGTLIKDQDETLLIEVDKFNSIVDQEMTGNFSLRGVQRWVSYYMTKMQRVANFSVPGSGKTAMVYGAYAYLSSDKIDKVDQIVMIGPKSSFISWKDEFQKIFSGKRNLKVIDIHDANFHESMFFKNPDDYDLILINYESIGKYQKQLENIINDKTMIVFDEVHRIKKIDSERAEIAIKLSNMTNYRYVLTGTPIPNTYLDIWNFLHILYDNEYKEYFGFSSSELGNINEVVKSKINDKLSPFFWRVTKKDLNVPPANEDQIYTYTASDDEQQVIDLLWKKYRHMPLKLYIRLIQFSSNPSLLSRSINQDLFIDNTETENSTERYTFEYDEQMEDDVSEFYTDDEIALLDKLETTKKFEACVSKIDELVNQNKTAIVWCIFVDTIDKVVHRVEELGHRVKFINGSVSSIDREIIIKQFQNHEFDVLVTNPHTLAESVSLHMACHDAIYLEYSFNLTHMLQSRDRIHRLGLPEDSYTAYYYFMLEGQDGGQNTIDQKIYTRLKEKEETMLAAVEGDNLNVNFSSSEKDEILSLMEEVME